MSPRNETVLYPAVVKWLAQHLRSRHPRAKVSAFDTHKTELSSFLRREGFHRHFPDSSAYEIEVDVTGVIERRDSVKLAFVECKIGPITLRDVGQLLGYSLVARPELSFLVSPRGLSDRLAAQLLTFGRQDILVYGKDRLIRLGVWDEARGELDVSTLVPKGCHSY